MSDSFASCGNIISLVVVTKVIPSFFFFIIIIAYILLEISVGVIAAIDFLDPFIHKICIFYHVLTIPFYNS